MKESLIEGWKPFPPSSWARYQRYSAEAQERPLPKLQESTRLPGFNLPGDISASRRYWDRDIVSPEFEVADGVMKVPTGPGLGVELDLDRIHGLTVREESFG